MKTLAAAVFCGTLALHQAIVSQALANQMDDQLSAQQATLQAEQAAVQAGVQAQILENAQTTQTLLLQEQLQLLNARRLPAKHSSSSHHAPSHS
jgi:hypothetical protein